MPNVSVPKPLAAIVFDMDGLMLDTERLGMRFWIEACAAHGYELSQANFSLMIGRTLTDNEKVLQQCFGEDFPFNKVREKRVELGNQADETNLVETKTGLLELLAFLDEQNIKRAVATSTWRERAMRKLKHVGLENSFHCIVTGDEVENGKPAPDIFLRAAEKLGAAPEHCIVLEDSGPGVKGTKTANMTSYLVPDIQQPSAETLTLADGVFDSLHAVLSHIENHILG